MTDHLFKIHNALHHPLDHSPGGWFLQNFAPNFIDREEPFVGLVSPELAKQTMEKAYLKYPDLHVTVEDAISIG